MRVVVTRPEHTGERTARLLRGLGHDPLMLPLSRPIHDAAAVGAALRAYDGALAVTSAEAIRSAIELGDQLLPHLARPLFAVGRATAREARRAGFAAVFASEGDGRALAELVRTGMASAQQAGLPLLYLAGLPRTAGFEARLGELKVPFVTVDCYRMVEVGHGHEHLKEMFLAQPPGAVLLYSRENAERFFRLPVFRTNPEALEECRILCLSAAVAAAVPEPYGRNVSVAPIPEEDSLLALLEAD